jgi:voltage-gated potassium channel
MEAEQRKRALDSVERTTEVPMLLLSLAMLPLLAVPLAFELSESVELTVLAVNWLIWALFALELVVKTYLAPNRRSYLRRHWFDVLIVALPLLRPLRITRSVRALRLARILRLGSVGVRSVHSIRAVLDSHGLKYILLFAGGLIVCSAALMTLF